MLNSYEEHHLHPSNTLLTLCALNHAPSSSLCIYIYDRSYMLFYFLYLLLFIHQRMQHPQPPNDDNEAEPQQELNPEDLDDDNDIGFNEIPLAGHLCASD
jgi:hypothetical protein